MIPVVGLVGVPVQVRRFAVEDVCPFGQLHDLGRVLLVEARIHHIRNLLTSRDGHKFLAQLAQHEVPLLLPVLEVKGGCEPVVIGTAVPQMLLHLLEPGSDRKAGGVQAFLINIHMELFLQGVRERRNAMIQRRGEDRKHRVQQDRKRNPLGVDFRTAFHRQKPLTGAEARVPYLPGMELPDVDRERVVIDEIPGIPTQLSRNVFDQAGRTIDLQSLPTAQRDPQQTVESDEVVHVRMGDKDLASFEEARGRKRLVFPEVEHESPVCPPYLNKQAGVSERRIDEIAGKGRSN